MLRFPGIVRYHEAPDRRAIGAGDKVSLPARRRTVPKGLGSLELSWDPWDTGRVVRSNIGTSTPHCRLGRVWPLLSICSTAPNGASGTRPHVATSPAKPFPSGRAKKAFNWSASAQTNPSLVRTALSQRGCKTPHLSRREDNTDKNGRNNMNDGVLPAGGPPGTA